MMLYSYTAFAERSFAIFEKEEAHFDPPAGSGSDMLKVSSDDSSGEREDAEESPMMRVALQVKQNAMSGLSIILTLMSILVAFR